MLHIPHGSRCDVVAAGAQMSVQIMLDVLHGPCPKPDAAQRHQQVIDALRRQDFLPKARCCTKASPRHSRSCEASADKIVSPNGHTQPTLPKPMAAQRLPKDIHALANSLQTRFHPKNQMLHTGTDKTYIHALASPLQTRLSPNGHNPLCHNSWLRRGANETLTLLLLRPLRKQDVILKARCCIKAPARYSHSLRAFCRQDCLPKRPQPTLP